MGKELPTKVMLGQTLVLMQITFLNNVRKVGRLVLSRTCCLGFILSTRSPLPAVIFKANKILLYGCSQPKKTKATS
jgi:hypothetical protein